MNKCAYDEKNLIVFPFAFDSEMRSGGVKTNKLDTYLKNAAVSVTSAKHYNPDDCVIFATNIACDVLPSWFVDLMEKYEIIIDFIPFDKFIFNNGIKWGLAFYKLCVFAYYLETTNCNSISYMDVDVYVQSDFSNIWRECGQNILVYDIGHGLQVPNYNTFVAELTEFCGHSTLYTQYGGEFVAVSREKGRLLLDEMYCVYEEMRQREFVTEKGDEFILCVSANRYLKKYGTLKNAAAYVCRNWTSWDFRLVSTNYRYNAVAVLHLPAEKQKGLLKIFDRYIVKLRIPSQEKVWRICRLSKQPIRDRVRYTVSRWKCSL